MRNQIFNYHDLKGLFGVHFSKLKGQILSWLTDISVVISNKSMMPTIDVKIIFTLCFGCSSLLSLNASLEI